MTPRVALALAIVPVVVVLALRAAGPVDLDLNDQAKQANYALNVWESGNWIIPTDGGAVPATKPPLYTWLCVVASALTGGPGVLAFQLVTAASMAVTAWLIYRIAAERFDLRAGVLAVWMLMSSHLVMKLGIHIRPDAVLVFLTTLSFFSVHRMDRGRTRGMAWLFWLSVSLSALAKGPVGPFAAGTAIGAMAIRRQWRPLVRTLLASPAVLLLLIPLAWFALALFVGGWTYLEGTVFSHTLDRAIAGESRDWQVSVPGTLVLYLLLASAPWCLLAAPAVVRWLRSADERERSEAWLLGAWCVPGLVLMSLSLVQRHDYVLPFLPPAVILCAAALLSTQRPWEWRLWRGFLLAAGLVAAAAAVLVLAGESMGIESVREAIQRSRWVPGLVLLGAAAALGALRFFRLELYPGALGCAAAVIALQLLFTFTLEPAALDGRGAALRGFCARVSEVRNYPEGVESISGVSGAVRFHLRMDRPTVTILEVAELFERVDAGGELYLIADKASTESLLSRFPGRFRVQEEAAYRRRGKPASVSLIRVMARR